MNNIKQFKIYQWILGGLVVAASVLVWYGYRMVDNQQPVDGYLFFPLFGLLAFGLMWTHYVLGALRRYFKFDKNVTARYSKATSWGVLALILAHPGILWLQLARDGYGLPPLSHFAIYNDPTAKFALLLGSISLIAFLAFEFHRKFSDASWWKYIDYSSIVAMIFIWFHALMLGGELSVTWYRLLWIIYGITMVISIIYIYTYRHKQGGVRED